MHLTTTLSILTALAAASPINSPSNPNSAPAAINKRFEASVPWIWRPRKTDFEQFEDNEATNNGADAADAATNKVKRFEASVPWIWRPKKTDFEQFEDGAGNADADATGETPGAVERAEGEEK
ncbi:hypothetical protein B0H65DRAFT_586382 [Neurospora tetraspora]|uniref:Uncharacterized protein n=1 Tax=Neurospora tetraspora TaxID=94610 RepID=A0AAE0MU34_9PEZI|nr:hypothetical protein B0H65DRAFT_586382 [Neurospora tetraspora]